MAKQRTNSLGKLALMERSREAKALRKKWTEEAEGLDKDLVFQSLSINDVLLGFYREEAGQTDFRTFYNWTQAGFKVKKGEKYFRIWGGPSELRLKLMLRLRPKKGEVLSFFLCAVCCMLGKLS